MIFKVLKDGKVMFWTEHKSCIPDAETIKQMKKAGYKISQRGIDKEEPAQRSIW